MTNTRIDTKKTLFMAPFEDEEEERAWIEREQEIAKHRNAMPDHRKEDTDPQ